MTTMRLFLFKSNLDNNSAHLAPGQNFEINRFGNGLEGMQEFTFIFSKKDTVVVDWVGVVWGKVVVVTVATVTVANKWLLIIYPPQFKHWFFKLGSGEAWIDQCMTSLTLVFFSSLLVNLVANKKYDMSRKVLVWTVELEQFAARHLVKCLSRFE